MSGIQDAGPSETVELSYRRYPGRSLSGEVTLELRGRIQVRVVLAGAQQARSPSAGVAGVGAGGRAEGWLRGRGLGAAVWAARSLGPWRGVGI